MGGAPALASPGARRRGDGRPRERVLGVADLLRAPGRALPGRHGLRGHAVGRRGAAGLHRVPARMVAEPADLYTGPLATRARGATANVGRREARVLLGLPGTALGRGDAGAARRLGARSARGRSGADT